MEYYFPLSDSFGCTHSIDMVYVEYFSYVSPKCIVEIVQKVHEDYPLIKYDEFLDRVPHNKWDYYLDCFSIGGARVSAGKYNNYDPVTKTFDLLPMFEIRVNPNKHMHEPWFQDMLSRLLECADCGVLRKYDYAVDIPLEMRCVQVLDTRKEPGLYKGTRYYGQAGRHGYLKIYDKQKDMKRQGEEIGTFTRVEHTLFTTKEPSLETVYILQNDSLKMDYADLKDTDRAIVEMFMQLQVLGVNYDLRLGRRKMQALEPYLQGQYAKLDYGQYLGILLDNIRSVFKANENLLDIDNDGFINAGNLDNLPFD